MLRQIKGAAGGDDFVEFLLAKSFDILLPDGFVEIRLTAAHMHLSIAAP